MRPAGQRLISQERRALMYIVAEGVRPDSSNLMGRSTVLAEAISGLMRSGSMYREVQGSHQAAGAAFLAAFSRTRKAIHSEHPRLEICMTAKCGNRERYQ